MTLFSWHLPYCTLTSMLSHGWLVAVARRLSAAFLSLQVVLHSFPCNMQVLCTTGIMGLQLPANPLVHRIGGVDCDCICLRGPWGVAGRFQSLCLVHA
jgi:hypothetical protein